MRMKLTTIPLAGADPTMRILATFDLVLSALSIILGRDQLRLSNGAECSPVVLDMLNLVAHWSTPEREVGEAGLQGGTRRTLRSRNAEVFHHKQTNFSVGFRYIIWNK